MEIPLESVKKFSDETKKRKDEYNSKDNSSENGDYPPLAFLNQGTIKLRFYPEIDDKGLSLIRRCFVYQFRGIPGVFPYVKGGPLEEAHKRATSNDTTKRGWAWKFGAKELGVARVVIFEATPSVKYYMIDKPQILIMRSKVIHSIDTFVSGIEPKELVEMLDPDSESFKIRIDWTSDICSAGIDLSRVKCPPLVFGDDEKAFPKLSECYFDENRVPTDEDLQNVNQLISEEIAKQKSSSDVYEPMEEEDAVDSLKKDDESDSKSEKSEDGKKQPESDQSDDPTCPSSEDELKYGKHPDDAHPDCLICPHEEGCLEKSGR